MRKAWKKAVSVLLILVLLFGVLPAMNVSAEGEGGQGSRSIELNFAGTVRQHCHVWRRGNRCCVNGGRCRIK